MKKEINAARITLDIAGLGIVFYSPQNARHISEGEDYMKSHYEKPEDVEEHIQKGTIVGFCTGSPGVYTPQFASGYPQPVFQQQSKFVYRLTVKCPDGVLCFRDLYDLMDWDPKCPSESCLEVGKGIFHVTLCTNPPPAGRLGDNQTIYVFLHKLDTFPKLARLGIPMLC